MALGLGLLLIFTSLIGIGRASGAGKEAIGDSLMLVMAASIVTFGVFALLHLRPIYVLLHALADGAIGASALIAASTGYAGSQSTLVHVVGINLFAVAFVRFVKYRRFAANVAAGIEPPAVAGNPFEKRANI